MMSRIPTLIAGAFRAPPPDRSISISPPNLGHLRWHATGVWGRRDYRTVVVYREPNLSYVDIVSGQAAPGARGRPPETGLPEPAGQRRRLRAPRAPGAAGAQ